MSARRGWRPRGGRRRGRPRTIAAPVIETDSLEKIERHASRAAFAAGQAGSLSRDTYLSMARDVMKGQTNEYNIGVLSGLNDTLRGAGFAVATMEEVLAATDEDATGVPGQRTE